jgi:hypothetical protein
MLKLGLQLLQQGRVIVPPGGHRLELGRDILQRARNVEDDPLPAEFAIRHSLPIASESLIAGAFGPDVGKPFRLHLITEQLLFVIRIAEVLHLQSLVLVERGEQQTKLFLKVIQIGDRAVGQVRRLEDEPLRT